MTLVQTELKKMYIRVDEPLPDYLCFTANTASSTVRLRKTGSPTVVSLETSTDGANWSSYTIGDTITLSNIGDSIYMRNTSETPTPLSTTSGAYYWFNMTGSIAASGDVNYLLCKNSTTEITYGYTFFRLFYNCTSLTTPPKLPATVYNFCYYEMFRGCSSLTTVPELPATIMYDSCYGNMFYGCTSLTSINKLPATTLNNSCYFQMYRGCSLIKISETQTGEYQTPYRIPTTGTGSGGSGPTTSMFFGTGGTFTSDPSINTTYYTSNTIVDSTASAPIVQQEKEIKRVTIRPNGTEKQIRPVIHGWQPGPNTIGYYPLNGDINDYSGNNRNLSVAFGTVSYTTLSSGIQVFSPRGTGWMSGGTGLSHSDSVWNFAGDFTVNFFAKLLQTYNNYMSFITNRYQSSYRRMNSIDASKEFYFHGQTPYRSGWTMDTNVWHNICCTVVSGTYYIYVDAVLKKSGSFQNSSYTPGTLNIGYGYYDTGNSYVEPLNGDISNVIIEDKGWTEQEVSDYYNQTKGNYGL